MYWRIGNDGWGLGYRIGKWSIWISKTRTGDMDIEWVDEGFDWVMTR